MMRKSFAKELTLMLCCLMVVFTAVSCGNDDDTSQRPNAEGTEKDDSIFTFTGQSLYDNIISNKAFSGFAYLLQRTGYDKILTSYGVNTVFAPTNSGLQSYVNGLYNDTNAVMPHHGLSSNSVEGLPDSICQRLVKQHIISSAALKTSELVENAGSSPAVFNDYGEQLFLSFKDSVWWAKIADKRDGATSVCHYSKLLQRDIDCQNGVLFVLEEPICGNLEVVSERQIYTEEDLLQTKEDTLFLLYGCYSRCAVFESYQQRLENMRLNHQPISSDDNIIITALPSGYQVINNVNYILSHLNADKQCDLLAQLQAIRAFTYYNMAMLWGRLILITTPILSIGDVEEINKLPKSSQEEVYNYAYNDICQALKYLPEEYDSNSQNLFTRNAGLMLKAELELTLKRNEDAVRTLQQVKAANIIFALANTEAPEIPIYTNSHYQLFMREAEGTLTIGSEAEWLPVLERSYGYWAMLKRLGMAQEVTGCTEYELFMPYP